MSGVNSLESNIQSSGVAIGYLSSDCWADIVFTAASTGVVSYKNNQGIFNGQKNINSHLIYSTAIADLDGDYKNDIILGGFIGSPSFILKNTNGINYQELNQDETGIHPSHYTVGFAMGDYDRDGDIDLLTSHWTMRGNIARSAHLRENIGNMLFSAKDSSKGLTSLVNSNDFTFSPAFADINGDGWLDILMAADFKTSQVYKNNNGLYVRATDTAAITDENGMGAAVADYDNDGDLDWFVTGIYNADEKYTYTGKTGNRLYVNDSQGVFKDATESAKVRNGGWGWGACAADFDNDGDVDIFQVNGYFNIPQKWLDEFLPEQNIRSALEVYQTPRANLFMNDGKAHFTEQSSSWQIADTKQGRGVACFDYDRDGDVDVVIANNQDKPSLYTNQISGKASANFVNIRLVGLSPNTQALGATVKIKINGVQQMRPINLNSNYLSHNLADAHFGLGGASKIDELRIVWPKDNKETILKDVSANQFLVIAHPDL